MAEAPVGDDQYGEDPSVNRLQERIAELLGKEAALFVPSGTMANQIGLKILTRPGDEVIVGDEAHIVWHESGAGAANSGVQFSVVGTRRAVHRGRSARGHTSRPATSSFRRPRWSRSRTPIIAAAALSSRRARSARSAPRRAQLGIAAISTGRGCSTPPRPSGGASPSWRRRSTSSRSPCRRGSAARSAACSPAAARTSRGRCGPGACSAARCANRASSRRPGSGRSTTISSGSPRTTPMRGCSPSGSPGCRGSASI